MRNMALIARANVSPIIAQLISPPARPSKLVAAPVDMLLRARAAGVSATMAKHQAAAAIERVADGAK